MTYKALNKNSWCCTFYSELRNLFKSLPKGKQIEILNNVFKEMGMTDIIKMCDVVDSCEECPRYGDDCDGDKK